MNGRRRDRRQPETPWARWLSTAGLTLEQLSNRYSSQGLMKLVAARWPQVLFLHETNQRVVGLTIDDGPHPLLTPRILDVLAEYNAHATFFMLSDRVRQYRKLVQHVVQVGHELGNHLCYDAPSIRLPLDELERQLCEAHEVLSTFAPIHWFRPGSAWFNQQMLSLVARHQYRIALASLYPYDAQLPYPALASNLILRNVFPGAIIALHEGAWSRRGTVRVLRTILPVLQEQGYQVLSLSELVSTPAD